MLRISYAEVSEGQRWTLSGRLYGPWVEVLRSLWFEVHQPGAHARAMVDLRDVTFIDRSGEQLLAEMHGGGAEFLAAGVENKHLLTTLRQNGSRPKQKEH